MRCRLCRHYLPAYAEGELPPRRQEEVKRHLAACAGCRAVLTALTDLDALLAVYRVPAVPAELTAPVLAGAGARAAPRARNLRAAGLALVVAFATSYLIFFTFLALLLLPVVAVLLSGSVNLGKTLAVVGALVLTVLLGVGRTLVEVAAGLLTVLSPLVLTAWAGVVFLGQVLLWRLLAQPRAQH
ncbi:MAG TPA: zf-HC2 domain-containing protein [Firmicutes bacterium]|nr:zf-HC2 domain-containing protein [Bacillota bacterium]